MIESKATKLLLASYILLVIWWLYIQFLRTTDSPVNYWFVFAYGLVPLFGGINGLFLSRKWGSFKSAMGSAVLYLSLGLITWGIGETIWSYYILGLNVEIPYPSLADASFILSWPLWSMGVINLSKATGIKFSLRNVRGKLLLLVVPFLVISASYYLLYVVARDSTIDLSSEYLKLFFDLLYPIWDVILLTLVLLVYGLSFGFLGGRFKFPITLILLGFVVNYFADMGLSYQSTVETFYNGGFVDLLFASAMFLLTYGTNALDVKYSDSVRSGSS
ncbi:hypothetical protein A2716_00335 [candidate division WWE3 bacterium RIFCSPHIGHO2_01_FULL_40_23]|uniref:Histidine kinase N-terminal 7TM region domain-containing protein n=1 Tax=candidate division WWE3 bacterium RIFCSPLOWO2_01_FULL_41_18 TaxID=1802625 RepID=A0A1F4VE45_UNCKA|nr:MAG: hypothetical protein A2716_00335 [candidate division WWE3 bacterium RIFCSPHIGHO2_01_FULL_40_23]OGC55444.1 MAG: hypothetical protein A3A78_00605 [candidate division WWE3 bacterium RIFCSPLOWO2_01_FULL_41_18]